MFALLRGFFLMLHKQYIEFVKRYALPKEEKSN